MDGVSVASGIAGLVTLALQVGGTIAIYVNAIKERSKNVKELQDELLLLGEVLSNLRDFVDSRQAEGKSIDSFSVLSKAIRDCRQRIERIGDRLKPPPDSGRVVRAINQLKWPFEQREVMQLVENLRRYSHAFQFAFTIEGFNLLSKSSDDATKGLQEMLEVSKKISELSAQMGLSTEEASKRAAQIEQIITLVPILAKTAVDVNEISQAARLAELREQERRTSDILDWLAPVSSLHKHRDLQARRAEGTGQWFLRHPDFLDWVEDAGAVHDLLCVGGPGTGKSVLSSHIVDFVRARFKDQDVAVAHYYFDYSEQQTQTAAAFARALLRQLSSQGNHVPSAVAEFYQRTRNTSKDQTWYHDLLGITRRVVATFSMCFIIVDAIDEAENHVQRSGFFEVIGAIRPSSGSTLKMLSTTRPHLPSLLNRFHEPVTIDVIADSRDLRQYLVRTIHEHPDSEELLDEELREQVVSVLTRNAHGIFLLPALQIKMILDQITKADVKRALLYLATDLTHAFQSTIQRISNLSTARRDLAFRVSMWLSHAQRPLTVSELQHALALRVGDADLDRDNFPSLRTLLDCCCGLVEVDHDSSTIRLVHHSLEEYLRTTEHGLFEKAHVIIVQTCIRYITLESLRSLPYKKRNEFAEALDEYALLNYAALEWCHHASRVSTADIQDAALSLLSDSLSLVTITRVRDFLILGLRSWRERTWEWAHSGSAGISLAAEFGLVGILKLLISKNEHDRRLSSYDVYGNTALHRAALRGHMEAADVLLGHGASVMLINHERNTPIYLAVSYQQLAMVKLLLRHGREQLDLPGPKGFTPLHKAVEQDDEEMVTILLQAGALVGATTDQGATPLHVAALRGYVSICRLLVLAGAFVHVKDKEGLCPLDHAATGGFTDLVRYLMENGGSMFHRGRELWTPLHRAARGGHTECVRFFLHRGSDLFLGDFKDNIPLHLAVRSGNIETVRALLDHNSDPAVKRAQLLTRDKKGFTPREVAFFTAHYDVHKYLRGIEWETQATEKPSRASLVTTAIESGDLDALRSHLESDPTALHALDDDGQPPLHIAVQENKKAIMDHLLVQGASIEAVGYHGWRALHIAASQGNLDLVDLCLSHGATVDARTRTNQTPLHKAASSYSVAVVQRLLSAGADPGSRNDRGMTPLHVAAHQNAIGIARLLVIDHGANVFTRDRMKLTAAIWAERSAHLELWAFLREEETKARARRRSLAAVHDEITEEVKHEVMEDMRLNELMGDSDEEHDACEDGGREMIPLR